MTGKFLLHSDTISTTLPPFPDIPYNSTGPQPTCVSVVRSYVTESPEWHIFILVNQFLVRTVPTIIICSVNAWMYIK